MRERYFDGNSKSTIEVSLIDRLLEDSTDFLVRLIV